MSSTNGSGTRAAEIGGPDIGSRDVVAATGQDPTVSWPGARPTRRRWPRVAAAALVVGVLVAALVLAVTALLPESWEGRVGVLASPVGSGGSAALARSGVSTSYGEVVALAMPSISDVVTSPSLLDAVVAAVPGSPSADDLRSRIGVELLPGSGVARISVGADSADTASRLAEAIGQQVVGANLLAPAGQLRTIDPRATVVQTSPDWSLGTGIALILGLVALLGTVALMRPFRPRVPARRAVLQAVTEAGRSPVGAFDVEDPALMERIGILARAADRPVRILAAGPGVDGAARTLRSELAGAAIAPHGRGDRVAPSVLVVVDRDDVRGDDIRAALAAVPTAEPLLAVVVV